MRYGKRLTSLKRSGINMKAIPLTGEYHNDCNTLLVEIARLNRVLSANHKIVNYCIGNINDSGKLKYIGQMARKAENG